jgi:hypothetical protein
MVWHRRPQPLRVGVIEASQWLVRANAKNGERTSQNEKKGEKRKEGRRRGRPLGFDQLVAYHPLNKVYGAYSSAICMAYLQWRSYTVACGCGCTHKNLKNHYKDQIFTMFVT